MSLSRSNLAILLLLCIASAVQAQVKQPRYADSIEAKIRLVENNLRGWIRFENGPDLPGKLADRMKQYNVRGLSIAIIRNYKVEWARGYGYADQEEQRPVTTETMFQAASISKSLNAVGVLKLVEEGKLRLDEDINKYLKSWHPAADSGKITIAHLLSHMAGLTVHGFRGYAAGETIPTIVQMLQGKRPANSPEVRPAFAPGKRFEYSGGGTLITQLIVTETTGMPYDQYMARAVLRPLGMTGSTFSQPAPASKAALLATGYRESGQPIKGKYHIYPEMAPAGLWTTPTDLGKYIIETQLAYAGRSSKVLSPAMTKTRLTPFIDKSAALGVFVFDTENGKYFNHNGGNDGFRSVYYGSLDGGYGMVLMVNSDNFNLLHEVKRSIAFAYGWDYFSKQTVKKLAAVPADTLKQYTGSYKFRTDTFTIAEQDGKMTLTINNSTQPMVMYFTSGTEFVMQEFWTPIRFIRGAKGFNMYFKDGEDDILFEKQ